MCAITNRHENSQSDHDAGDVITALNRFGPSNQTLIQILHRHLTSFDYHSIFASFNPSSTILSQTSSSLRESFFYAFSFKPFLCLSPSHLSPLTLRYSLLGRNSGRSPTLTSFLVILRFFAHSIGAVDPFSGIFPLSYDF